MKYQDNRGRPVAYLGVTILPELKDYALLVIPKEKRRGNPNFSFG